MNTCRKQSHLTCLSSLLHLYFLLSPSSSLPLFLLAPVPPSIREEEREQSVVEHTSVQLPCVAEGVPQPSVMWEKDGAALGDSSGEYTILPSGELVIDSALVRAPSPVLA